MDKPQEIIDGVPVHLWREHWATYKTSWICEHCKKEVSFLNQCNWGPCNKESV